jgi:hypothetical protein
MATLYLTEWFGEGERPQTIEMSRDEGDALLSLEAFVAGLRGTSSRAGYLPNGDVVAGVTKIGRASYRIRPDDGRPVYARVRAIEDEGGPAENEPCETCQAEWDGPFGACSHDNAACICADDCGCCRPLVIEEA